MADVTVITPAIPKRWSSGFLQEAIQSVREQTLLPAAHLIHVDYDHAGTVASLNRLLAGVETPYLAVLSDDDVFYPQHLARLRESIDEHAVAYSWCDCDDQIPHTTDGSAIAANCLMSTQIVKDIGGWWTDPRDGNSLEDFRMWDKMQGMGLTFKCVPEVTWRYRFHGDNQSRKELTEIL